MRFLLRPNPANAKARQSAIGSRCRYYAVAVTVMFQLMVAVCAVRVWTERPDMIAAAAPDVISMVVRALPHSRPDTPRPPDAEPQAKQEDIPAPDLPEMSSEKHPDVPPEPPAQDPPQDHEPVEHEFFEQPEETVVPLEPIDTAVHKAAHEAVQADVLLALLIQQIEKHKSYPRAARRARLQGVVTIKVSIDHQTRIAAFTIVDSSGYRVLDRATEDILHKISGTRLSHDNLERPLDIVVPIRFEII